MNDLEVMIKNAIELINKDYNDCQDPEIYLKRKETRKKLIENIKKLDKFQATILCMHYGIGNKIYDFSELAKIFNMKKDDIRKINATGRRLLFKSNELKEEREKDIQTLF